MRPARVKEVADFKSLMEMSLSDLKRRAKRAGVEETDDKAELVYRLMRALNTEPGTEYTWGVLEILPDGWGFLRRHPNFQNTNEDVYVSQSQIKRFGLRTGDLVFGGGTPAKRGRKVLRVASSGSH